MSSKNFDIHSILAASDTWSDANESVSCSNLPQSRLLTPSAGNPGALQACVLSSGKGHQRADAGRVRHMATSPPGEAEDHLEGREHAAHCQSTVRILVPL